MPVPPDQASAESINFAVVGMNPEGKDPAAGYVHIVDVQLHLKAVRCSSRAVPWCYF